MNYVKHFIICIIYKVLFRHVFIAYLGVLRCVRAAVAWKHRRAQTRISVPRVSFWLNKLCCFYTRWFNCFINALQIDH